MALTRNGGTFESNWSTGRRTSGIRPGDRLFLLRQADYRGFVASGHATSEVYLDRHWRNPDAQARYVEFKCDVLLSPEDRLRVETLDHHLPKVLPWSRMQTSGLQVPPEHEALLEQLWRTHLTTLGHPAAKERSGAATAARGPAAPTAEADAPAGGSAEGPATEEDLEGERLLVERTELRRLKELRRRCLEIHGSVCRGCGVTLTERYGPLAEGAIEVHHLRPLASLDGPTPTDPERDLVPVCPNCHTVLHRRSPPLELEALRALLAAQARSSEGRG